MSADDGTELGCFEAVTPQHLALNHHLNAHIISKRDCSLDTIAAETASAVVMMTLSASLDAQKQRVVDSLTPFQNQHVLKDCMVQQATGSFHIGGQEGEGEEEAGNKVVWRRRLTGPHHQHQEGSHDHNEEVEALVYFQDVLIRWKWESVAGQNLVLQLELQVAVATLTSLDTLFRQEENNNTLSMPKFSSSNSSGPTVQISLQIAQVLCYFNTTTDTGAHDASRSLTTTMNRPLLSSIFRNVFSLEFLLFDNRTGSAGGTNMSINTQVTVGELLLVDRSNSNSSNNNNSVDSSSETNNTKTAIVTAHNVERLDDFTSRMDGLIWRNQNKSDSDSDSSMHDSVGFQFQARNLQLAWTGTTLFVHIQALDECTISAATHIATTSNTTTTGEDGKDYDGKLNNDGGGACFCKLENTEPICNLQLQFHHHHQQPHAQGGGSAAIIIDEDLTLNFNEDATFCVSQQHEKGVKHHEQEMDESKSQDAAPTLATTAVSLGAASATPSPPSHASLSRLVQAITSRFVMIMSKKIHSSCWSSWKPPRKIQLESKCLMFSWHSQQGGGGGGDLDLVSNDAASMGGMELAHEDQQQVQLVLDQFSVCVKQQPQALPQTGTSGMFLFALQVGKLELVPIFNVEQFQVSGCWADDGDSPPQAKLDLVSVECGGPITIETTCDAKTLLSNLLDFLDDNNHQGNKSLDESWDWLLNTKVPHAAVSELKYNFQPKINDDCVVAFQGNVHTTVRTMMQHYADTLIDRIQISEQRFVHRILSASKSSRVSFSDTVATTVGRAAIGASIVAPIGLVASVAAVGIKDGVQSVAAAGKESRGAHPDDAYKFGDVLRGTVAGVQNVAARGRRSRGASADDSHKPGDFLKGIGDSLRQTKRDLVMKNQLDAAGDDDETMLDARDKGESYIARNKSRYGGVVGSSLGAVAGLVVLGPIGMIAGSLAGGVAAASYIERSEKSSEGKIGNGSEQQPNTATGETLKKAGTTQSSEGEQTVSSTPVTADGAPAEPSTSESSDTPTQTSATASASRSVAAVETLKASRLLQFTQGVIASGKKVTGREDNSEYKFGDLTRGLWAQKK